MKNNLIFFQPITQYVNTGDLIICRSLLEHLRQYGDLIINDRDIPQWFLEELGMQESERLSSYSKLSFYSCLLRRSLLTYLTGKSKVYLFLTPGHLLDRSFKIDIRNLIIAPVFGVFKLAGCKLVKIGVSLGPLSSVLAKSESIRAAFMEQYYVRDMFSWELAQEIGIKKVEFFPDLSWTFNLQVSRDELIKFDDRDILFISFRTKTYSRAPETNYPERVIKALEHVLKNLNHKKAFSKIVVGYQVGYDQKFCKQIYRHFQNQYQIEFQEERITVNTARNIFEKAKYIISNRLHVLLYGARYGALPIPLINSEVHLKIIGIFEECDLDSLVIDINHEGDDLNKRLTAIVQTQNETIYNIGQVVDRYSKQSNQMISNIFN